MDKYKSTFWSKVNKTDSCWLWTACINPHGQGVFKHGHQTIMAHKYSYELVRGKVPRGIYLLHACANSRCVNPDHLMLSTPENRLWANVHKTDFCWEWTGEKIIDGYGRITVNGKNILTHRLSWELHFEKIPRGLDVLHHCDNPSCVRPGHLFLGDQQANNRDKIKKGRHAHGESHGRSKLTEEEVVAIRESDLKPKRLSQIFGVSRSTIENVKQHKTWRHLSSA